MAKNSKRYNELLKSSKDFKSTDLKEIIENIKKNCTSKFDESIDISMRIGLKQSKGGDFNLRTVTQLPAGTGKKVRVAVLCEADKVDEAKKSGADVAGAEDGYPNKVHAKAFDRAHASFFNKTAHAGEGYGPESIYQAICDLHAERIGHGFHLFSADKVSPAVKNPEEYVLPSLVTAMLEKAEELNCL